MKLRNLAVALAVTGASACWTFGGSPVATGFTTSVTGSISVTTGSFPPPQVTLHSADDCKNGGWATSTNPVFTNQGDCVSHFTPAGGNGPKQATPAPAAATRRGTTDHPDGPLDRRGRSGSGRTDDPGVPRGRSGSRDTDDRGRFGRTPDTAPSGAQRECPTQVRWGRGLSRPWPASGRSRSPCR